MRLRQADDVVGVAATGPHDVWLAGTGGLNLLMRWNGRQWSQVAMPAAMSRSSAFGGIVMTSPSSVWVTGLVPAATTGFTGGGWHWDGHRWKMFRLPVPCLVTDTAADGHGGIWAYTQPCSARTKTARFWHLHAGHWHSYPVPGSGVGAYVLPITAVPGTNTTLAGGVGRLPGKLAAVVLANGRLP